jgi:hypothetical protein
MNSIRGYLPFGPSLSFSAALVIGWEMYLEAEAEFID